MSRLIRRRQTMAEMQRRADDILYQQRWFHYAKAAGMFLPGALDDDFLSEEQELFFLEYELQMEDGGVEMTATTAAQRTLNRQCQTHQQVCASTAPHAR